MRVWSHAVVSTAVNLMLHRIVRVCWRGAAGDFPACARVAATLNGALRSFDQGSPGNFGCTFVSV